MKSEKGQSLVEFALVVPVLVLLLFGIADFGRAFHAYLTIDHAGREAARAASIGEKDIEKIKQIAKDNGTSIGLTKGMVSVSLGVPPSNDATIKISYPFTFITPVIGEIAKKLKFDKLEDTTVMRIEK